MFIIKRTKLIFSLIIVLGMLSCILIMDSSNVKKEEYSIRKLKITECSNDYFIAKEINSDIKYRISKSSIKITDNFNNVLAWSDLKENKIIEVYYTGGIKETSPATFSKIEKIVILYFEE